MRPASFDLELSTAWSLWVLEHDLPAVPDRLPDGASVPVTCWRDHDSAAVLHVRRWSSDEDQEPCTEVDVEVFELVDGSWHPVTSGGAGGWADAVVRPRTLDADHADLGGVVQGTVGGVEVVALWGQAGASAVTVEVEQDGVVTTGPVVGQWGWVVASAVVRGPVVVHVRDGSSLSHRPVPLLILAGCGRLGYAAELHPGRCRSGVPVAAGRAGVAAR